MNWRDGLAAAMKLLSERHEVQMFADTPYHIPHTFFEIRPVSEMDGTWPDVILHWGDMTRPHATEHVKYGKPMAICFAGGEPLGYNHELFDHVFVESGVYKEVFDAKGISCSIAFGTNTDLFQPIPEQDKIFDVYFPATYAKWKRHDLLAAATKNLSVVTSGYMYPGTWESECYEVMQQSGALVLPHLSAQALRHLYAASRTVVIPSRSSGGSQRTVLEAMAMNVPLVITDSDKFDYAIGWKAEPYPADLREEIDLALREGEAATRQYVLENWSHVQYAEAIERGLERLVA